jgi:peptide/nickel transport system substrate-binding protein
MAGLGRRATPEDVTRRELVRGTLVGGAALSLGGVLAACGGGASTPGTQAGSPASGPIRRGGILRMGATGGGTRDTLDAHNAVGIPDDARRYQLFEPLARRNAQFEMEMLVAESIGPAGKGADAWVVRLRDGVEFHNGKTVTPEDVIYSIRRILDPKNPKVGAASIGYIDAKGLKKVDARTVRIPLKLPNAAFTDDIGQYFNGIVPVGFDPQNPVGTGPFKFKSFKPGDRSVFDRNPNYWVSGRPYLDQVVIINFADDTARVNALLSGEVDCISNLPSSQIATANSNPNIRVLNSQGGTWQPFTMRVDQAPFDDERVRQAFRLLVDRKQMVEQALSGQGRIANDIYAPYDPCYNDALPQRTQDLEQAKSLLRAAGHSNLTVELVTAPVFQGVVDAAQVFAEQAKGAGVTVKVRKVDTNTFYGDDYLKWTFAQDFWYPANFLGQVAQGSLPEAPFNETHWNDAEFNKLVNQARAELDEAKRAEIIGAAQKIEYERGGYIIPYFPNQVDAYSAKLAGLRPSKSGIPLANYEFKSVGFTA